jgi:hypothetical protein
MKRRTLLTGVTVALAGAFTQPASASFAQRQSDTIRRVFAEHATITRGAAHGKLIAAMRVVFIPIEEGAPGIDGQFPFGRRRDTVKHALALLGTSNRTLAVRTIAEAGRILPEYIARAQLAPGRYKVPDDMAAYFSTPESGVGKDGTFAFGAAHAALLKAANWVVVDHESIDTVLDMDMWPMPYIDGKQPYGDMSFFQIDMARLLGEPYARAPDQSMIRDAQKDAKLAKLHNEMTAALQIFLINARIPA